MPKNRNKTKNSKTNFDLTANSSMENVSIMFKFRISQLIAKILLKQQSLNQIRHCLTGHQFYINHKAINLTSFFL